MLNMTASVAQVKMMLGVLKKSILCLRALGAIKGYR